MQNNCIKIIEKKKENYSELLTIQVKKLNYLESFISKMIQKVREIFCHMQNLGKDFLVSNVVIRTHDF